LSAPIYLYPDDYFLLRVVLEGLCVAFLAINTMSEIIGKDIVFNMKFPFSGLYSSVMFKLFSFWPENRPSY
jgi:hypothetical protein